MIELLPNDCNIGNGGPLLQSALAFNGLCGIHEKQPQISIDS